MSAAPCPARARRRRRRAAAPPQLSRLRWRACRRRRRQLLEQLFRLQRTTTVRSLRCVMRVVGVRLQGILRCSPDAGAAHYLHGSRSRLFSNCCTTPRSQRSTAPSTNKCWATARRSPPPRPAGACSRRGASAATAAPLARPQGRRPAAAPPAPSPPPRATVADCAPSAPRVRAVGRRRKCVRVAKWPCVGLSATSFDASCRRRAASGGDRCCRRRRGARPVGRACSASTPPSVCDVGKRCRGRNHRAHRG